MQTAFDETGIELVKNERVLWLAVVERALHDALESKPLIQRRAIDWLLHDDVDFPTICEMAGLDYEYLRKQLVRQMRRFRSLAISVETGVVARLMPT